MFPNLLSLAGVLWDTVIEFYWRHYHIHKQASVLSSISQSLFAGPTGDVPRAEADPSPERPACGPGRGDWPLLSANQASCGQLRGSSRSSGTLEGEERKI